MPIKGSKQDYVVLAKSKIKPLTMSKGSEEILNSSTNQTFLGIMWKIKTKEKGNKQIKTKIN